MDKTDYWSKWRDRIKNTEMIDIKAPNHILMLFDTDSFEQISTVCEKIYND